MKSPLQQQLNQKHKKRRGPKRIEDLHIQWECYGCGIAIDVLKDRYNRSISKKFYHNRECYYKTLSAETRHKMMIKCSGCGIHYLKYKSEIYASKTKKFYHDKQCFLKFSNYKNGALKKYVNGKLRCRHCGEFVDKKDALLYTTKNKKRQFLTCPDPTCKKYPLQSRPRGTKAYQKLRDHKINNK